MGVAGRGGTSGRRWWLRGNMRQICDACMPRATASPARRAVYWWTEIAQLRRRPGPAHPLPLPEARKH